MTTPSAPPSPLRSPSPSPAPSATSRVNALAVIDVNGEIYRIELIGPENLDHARALIAGGTDAPIPSGVIVPGEGDINAPWSWHIDPTTLEWADATTEACDGTPSQIEDGTFTYPRFCPWSAKVIELE